MKEKLIRKPTEEEMEYVNETTARLLEEYEKTGEIPVFKGRRLPIKGDEGDYMSFAIAFWVAADLYKD